MDSAKIKDWLEIVGIFGVIASLVFVGMEMRQSQKIAVANINSERTTTAIQLLTEFAANPVATSAAIKVRSSNTNNLTESEKLVTHIYSGALSIRYADIYWQYANGFVPESRWRAVRTNLKNRLRADSMYRAFVENDAEFSDEMRRVVQEILSEVDAGN